MEDYLQWKTTSNGRWSENIKIEPKTKIACNEIMSMEDDLKLFKLEYLSNR